MKTYICTRKFQFRGSMVHSGQRLLLTDAEAKDPFIAAHIRTLNGAEKPNAQAEAPNLTNGEEKEPETDAPAKIAGEVNAEEMSVKELRASLGKMGVPCPPNLKKEDLLGLFEDAREALSGTAEESNRPGEEGK
jgi:hypothetical protein